MIVDGKTVVVPGNDQVRVIDRIMELLSGKKRLLVLTHTNPDPDALASGQALCHLARERAGLETCFAYKGDIFREENKKMVALLMPGLVRLREIDHRQFDCVAVVDTQPGFGHTQIPDDVFPQIVLDHHCPPQDLVFSAALAVIRPDVGALSSLLTQLLVDADVSIPPVLATALFYGLYTDTADLSRDVSPVDDQANVVLGPLVDRSLMRKISQPALPRSYFSAFHHCLETAEIYGKLVVSSLGATNNPEMVAEMADLLLRLDGVEWSACGGLFDGVYYISLRAVGGKETLAVLGDVLKDRGTYGGHGTVAGGRVLLMEDDPRALKRLELELTKAFLEVLGERGKEKRSLARAWA